jgi:hypothetical protein
VLNDFVDELAEVKALRNIEDSTSLGKYLIPMIDAMVAAHGGVFYGTPKSTFSSYITRQLNPVYTGGEVLVEVTE